jgi:hypothetical protein
MLHTYDTVDLTWRQTGRSYPYLPLLVPDLAAPVYVNTVTTTVSDAVGGRTSAWRGTGRRSTSWRSYCLVEDSARPKVL